jgi:AcrR family transcriptional regulator
MARAKPARPAADSHAAASPAGPRPGGGAPVPGRRAQQRRETERLILDTALALFSAGGFDATTTKQIADAAGVAHGTVFLVAPTKEALLIKLLEARLREIVAARTASLGKRKLVGQLGHVFDGLFDFYAAEPRLSRAFLKGVMFPAEPIARATYADHVAGFSRYLAGLFDAARGRGEVAAGVDSAAAAAAVLALYVFCVVDFLTAEVPDRAALGAAFRAGLGQLAHGFAPH